MRESSQASQLLKASKARKAVKANVVKLAKAIIEDPKYAALKDEISKFTDATISEMKSLDCAEPGYAIKMARLMAHLEVCDAFLGHYGRFVGKEIIREEEEDE